MTVTKSQSTVSSESFITDAIARLQSQAAAGDRLAELAREQGALIESGAADDLMGVIEQRQTLIDEMLSVIGEIGPLADAVQRSPQGATDSQREAVRGLVDSISSRLAEVIDIDTRDRTLLQRRLKEIDRERSINGSARSARVAYAGGGVGGRGGNPDQRRISPAVTRFTDQTG